MTKPGKLICENRQASFAQIDAEATRVASGFTAAGVVSGGTVAIMMRNDFPFFTATLAASMIEATATPINWHFTAKEAAYLLGDCAARILVVHADIWWKIGPDIPLQVLDGMTIVAVPTPEDIARAYGIPAAACRVPEGVLDWTDWTMRQPEWSGPPPKPQSAMIYTSGTTGQPKGVRRLGPTPITRRGNYNSFVEGAQNLVVTPMYHSAPSRNALGAFYTGGEIVLQPRFDAEQFLALVARHRISHVFIVPTMMVRLLKLPPEVRARYDVSSLDHVVHAGAPCPPEVKRQIIDWWGPVIYEYYGGTETGAVTYCSSRESIERPGTVGRAVPDATIRILDKDGNECSTNVPGEVFCRLHVMPDFTYHGQPEERARIERHGLITCGDIGYLDADGYLFLTDRKSDMVISGGVNIYPAQIEAVLISHPDILDCAVFGLPDDDLGETVAVALLPVEGRKVSSRDVQGFLADKIAHYMIPRLAITLSELPRDASGKMFKRKLRESIGAPAPNAPTPEVPGHE